MKPNCSKCKHYYITFNQDVPRGCRAYGIQSASSPLQVIRNANSGQDCLGFELKDREKEKKKKDLNDPRYWEA
ncbi:MAG: hypothetical protein CME64_12535 [Halobacteriovoraceae bacterium]|nr:hypothetical protein [Halobacteriovoraceae bacterium]|tara:strand:+ start:188255 stop:188473 length:219 start_codon:yes stop_codon:yes gene_type:complete